MALLQLLHFPSYKSKVLTVPVIFLSLTRSLAFMGTYEIPIFLTLETILPIPPSHMDPTVSSVPIVTTVPTVHTIPKFSNVPISYSAPAVLQYCSSSFGPYGSCCNCGSLMVLQFLHFPSHKNYSSTVPMIFLRSHKIFGYYGHLRSYKKKSMWVLQK